MLQRIAALVKVDFAPTHRPPPLARVLLATLAAIVLSMLADALVVAVAGMVLPGTKGYVHFRFSDYAKLTVIGVIIACAAWPVVTWISSAPRWLFFRLAIAVTVALWLPDVYILMRGQSVATVAVLMVMHVPIALVTYNLLVRVAPVRRPRQAARAQHARSSQ